MYDQKSLTLSAMKYSDFLKELSRLLNINIATVHQSIIESEIDINKYLNQMTLRILKQGFDHYLMANCFDRFSIEYQKVSNTIHPTKLTDGKVKIFFKKQFSRSKIAELIRDCYSYS